jgi:hypothetical protein
MNAVMVLAKGLWILIKETCIAISIHLWVEKLQNHPGPVSKVLLIAALLLVIALAFAEIMHQRNKRLGANPNEPKAQTRIAPRSRGFKLAITVGFQMDGKWRRVRSFLESESGEAEDVTSVEHLVPGHSEVVVPLPTKSLNPEGTAHKAS